MMGKYEIGDLVEFDTHSIGSGRIKAVRWENLMYYYCIDNNGQDCWFTYGMLERRIEKMESKNLRIDEAIKMVADGEVDEATYRNEAQGINGTLSIVDNGMIWYRGENDNGDTFTNTLPLDNWQPVEKAMSFGEAMEYLELIYLEDERVTAIYNNEIYRFGGDDVLLKYLPSNNFWSYDWELRLDMINGKWYKASKEVK